MNNLPDTANVPRDGADRTAPEGLASDGAPPGRASPDRPSSDRISLGPGHLPGDLPAESSAGFSDQAFSDSGRASGEPPTAAVGRRRAIRSFVLREGRLTSGQERAFRDLWPKYGVDWTPGMPPLDSPTLFGNDRPLVLEIGFGNGESLAAMAAQEPDRNWLGIEVHRPGVGHLLLEIERRGLTNLRVVRHDAVEFLRDGLRPAALVGVQLFFPDPWPKLRHHKRRILDPAFLDLAARALAPGGFFHAATDWPDYAAQMLKTLEADGDRFVNTAGPGCFAPRPDRRPPTRFERRGERLGHPVRDLIFRRR